MLIDYQPDWLPTWMNSHYMHYIVIFYHANSIWKELYNSVTLLALQYIVQYNRLYIISIKLALQIRVVESKIFIVAS